MILYGPIALQPVFPHPGQEKVTCRLYVEAAGPRRRVRAVT
ncbi:hypothetical protein [Carbonactinospora thermoautotrophica]|nr:hypothetical protein [Carbonactinospora thermoautotrophica]